MARWGLWQLSCVVVALSCSSESEDGSRSTSSSGSGGATSSSGSGGDCPPECFAEVRCVSECGETPVSYGCCPCPEGMIDANQCSEQCGNVGQPCPGEGTCGGGLSCFGSVCAPDAPMCAPPPGGVGCDANTACLVVSGTQSGICVTPQEQGCLCAGAGTFDCP